MTRKRTRSLLCLLLAALMLCLSACGKDDSGSGQGGDDVLLPISINGKEIRVGDSPLPVRRD